MLSTLSLLLSQIRIRVGEYDFASLLEPYPYIEKNVVKKVVHPSYNFFTYENDLALVKVDESLDFGAHVAPICLPPNAGDLVGKNATVTGWGRLSEGWLPLARSGKPGHCGKVFCRNINTMETRGVTSFLSIYFRLVGS